MMSRRSVPRYQQIFLALREKILTDRMPPGTRISSEAELSRAYGVSRITSQRALNELAKAGLVTREKGRGTLVREHVIRPPAMGESTGDMPMTARFIGQSRVIGQSEIQLLAFSREPAPAHVLERLQLEPGSDVYFIDRIRSSDGTPFCHVHAYVPIEIGRTFSPAALESRMLIDLIEEAGHQIATAEQVVTAAVADAVLAGHLDIGIGAPVLYFARTVYDADGAPTEYAEAHFRPDKFRLSMSLESDTSDAASDRTPAIAAGE